MRAAAGERHSFPVFARQTVRLRLTVLYGALFLLCGVALLAITYVLVDRATSGAVVSLTPNGIEIQLINHSVQAPTDTGSTVTKGQVMDSQQQALMHQLQMQTQQLHDAVMQQLLISMGIALAVMAVVSIAVGWVFAGRTLRPLKTITASARSISATDLHRRLALQGPQDEIKELGDTFDGLLARLEAAFEAQRRFIANASHELRTPLARQRTLAQVALADPHATAESLRAAHERVLASGAEEERLIEALLTLARGQAGLKAKELFDLASITEEVLVTRVQEAERLHLALEVELRSASAAGDRQLVQRLVSNLVDNALRHNCPDGWVRVSVRAASEGAVLTVANSGPTVSAVDAARLGEPFQRVVDDRTGHRDGTGLGLSIVNAIAAAHGAALDIRPRTEGGLEVTVTFSPTMTKVP